MISIRLVVAGIVLALVGCTSAQEEMPVTWDLRGTADIEAVGLPQDEQGRTGRLREVPDDLRAILPEDLELRFGAWGSERVEVSQFLEDEGTIMTIRAVMPRESPAEARERAQELGAELGLDVSPILAWTARPTRGEGTVFTADREVGSDPPWAVYLLLVPGGDSHDPTATLQVVTLPIITGPPADEDDSEFDD